MDRDSNIVLAERWYEALATGDLDSFKAVHHADCIYDISGHTPISGQVRGIETLMQDVTPLVFGALDMENYRFGVRRQIMCADDRRVVGIMEADGPGINGLRYDQRYLHMFQCEDGLITQVWEFFDTALANAVMFHDPALSIPTVDSQRFSLS